MWLRTAGCLGLLYDACMPSSTLPRGHLSACVSFTHCNYKLTYYNITVAIESTHTSDYEWAN